MAFRPVRLPPEVPGKLLLSSMPGRFETYKAFEELARTHALRRVVCLTPLDEVAELSPQYHAAIQSGRLFYRWHNVPVRNFGVPDDAIDFRRDIQSIADALRDGDAVLLHCAAGMGRTGSAAACVLKALGLPTHDALQRVRDAGSNPQNAAQSGVVDWF